MASSNRSAAVAAIAVAIGAASIGAQQTTPFRTTANVIAVEASVYDKSGKPVTDLTAADFQIVEDGQSLPAQTIYLVSSDPNIVRAGVSNTAMTSSTTGPVRRELRPRVMVFVFDLTHLSADGYKRSRTAVESFLKDNSASADLVGIVAGTMLNNKIDSDKAALLKAMSSMKGPNQQRYNLMRSWPRFLDEAEAVAVARMDHDITETVVRRACTEDPGQCERKGQYDDEIARKEVEAKSRELASAAQRDSAQSLAAIQTLANGLGRLPGSKNVLVFSDGFFTGEQLEQLRDTVTLAARNDVRISTFDARGLNKDPRSQNFMGTQPLIGPGDLSSPSIDGNADALSSLAIDTGGEVIMNRNDLRPGIDIVATQAGTYYVLGYAPTRQMDGKYHGISVRVSRPDVTVRARKGYVAVAAPAVSVPPAPPASATPVTQPAVIAPPAPVGPPPTPPTIPAPPPPTMVPSTELTSPVPAVARFRPNSDKNVSALTKVTPGSAGSAEAKSLADEGWDAYALGDVAVAREKLSAAVATGKAAPWVAYALGFADYALGQYDAAASAWTAVQSAVPQFMPVYFDLADAYISLGRGTDALAVLRDAARRWPTEPEAQNALGTTLVKRGAYDDAIDIFTRITTARPTDSLGFFNLGRAYQLRYLRLQQSAASARVPATAGIGDDDRLKALAAYRQYVTLGGPFEKEAKDAIAMLDWK